MTRLPDGRVLKGSRPAQRKEAQFWTGIANETEGLIKQVETPETLETLETLEAPVVSETSTTSPEEKATKGRCCSKFSCAGEKRSQKLYESRVLMLRVRLQVTRRRKRRQRSRVQLALSRRSTVINGLRPSNNICSHCL